MCVVYIPCTSHTVKVGMILARSVTVDTEFTVTVDSL